MSKAANGSAELLKVKVDGVDYAARHNFIWDTSGSTVYTIRVGNRIKNHRNIVKYLLLKENQSAAP